MDFEIETSSNNSENSEEFNILKSIKNYLDDLKERINSYILNNLSIVVSAIPELSEELLNHPEPENCIDIICKKTRICLYVDAKSSSQPHIKFLLESSLSFEKWCRIYTKCAQFIILLSQKDYSKSVKVYINLKDSLLIPRYVPEEKPLQLIFMNEVKDKKEILLEDLKEIWHNMASCKNIPNDGASLDIIDDDGTNVMCIIESLDEMNIFQICLEEFRKDLYEYVLQPILESTISIKEKKSASHRTMTFVAMNSNKLKMTQAEHSFKNMSKLVDFLSDSFFSTKYKGGTLLRWLGNNKASTLSNDIAKKCILPAMFGESKLKTQYNELLMLSAQFFKLLAKVEFVNPDNKNSILINTKYYHDESSIQLCNHFVTLAADYAERGLFPAYLTNEETRIELIKFNEKNFPYARIGAMKLCLCYAKNMSNLPASKISISIQQILFLVEYIFMESIRAGSQCDSCYLTALNEILSFYANEKDVYCEKEVGDSPERSVYEK